MFVAGILRISFEKERRDELLGGERLQYKWKPTVAVPKTASFKHMIRKLAVSLCDASNPWPFHQQEEWQSNRDTISLKYEFTKCKTSHGTRI